MFPTEDIWTLFRTYIYPLTAAGAAAWLIWYLTKGLLAAAKSAPEKALADYSGKDEGRKSAGIALMGSQDYKIRLAFAAFGLHVDGWEKPIVYAAYGLVSLSLIIPVLLTGLPPVLVIGIPFMSIVAVNAFVDSKWDKMKLDFEKEIPVMLNRLASVLKANPNLIESLDNIAEGLDPNKPLKSWLKNFASRLQSAGRSGLAASQAEAELISPSLLLAVVQIGRLWETGGKGYSDALRMTAANMADLLETRSQASAVAAGAWGTTRTILLGLGFTLGMVLISPVSKPYFSTPFMQLALLVVMIWGSMGYWNIKDSINEVIE